VPAVDIPIATNATLIDQKTHEEVKVPEEHKDNDDLKDKD